jgi:predicted SAM-dependent methyltransferase
MSDGIWLNVGCGTHYAPPPWWNIDTVKNDEVHPDQVIDPNAPLPFEDKSCDRVLLSHVLEHVPWEQVPAFLADIRRIARAEVLVVGPDTYRVIQSYADGTEPWSIVTSVIEHKDHPDDMLTWPGAPHHWNCHEARVHQVATRAGFHAAPVLDHEILNDWPVVAWNPRWQFALMLRDCERTPAR